MRARKWLRGSKLVAFNKHETKAEKNAAKALRRRRRRAS